MLTLGQHFKENPFFSDATLTRKYPLKKGVAPAPEDGTITEQMREFDPEEHLEAVVRPHHAGASLGRM